MAENPLKLGWVGDLASVATSFPVPSYQTLHRTARGELVVANLAAYGQLGWQTHSKVDQHTTVHRGQALVVMKRGKDQEQLVLRSGDTVWIPAGIQHNITNMEANQGLYMTSLYTPPHH